MWKRWTRLNTLFLPQAFFTQEVQQLQLQANLIFCITIDQNVSCAHLPILLMQTVLLNFSVIV